jgi:hypothetical protein
MRLAILDALIQIHVRVPKTIGQALLSRYPAQALIFLYRDGCPDAGDNVAMLNNTDSDEAWLLAAQCLANQKGGLLELLQRFKVEGQVKVYDGGRGEGELFGGSPSGTLGVAAAFTRVPGWPEPHTYALSTGRDVSSGHTWLLGQRYPVFYTRLAGIISDASRVHGDRNEYILELLGESLGPNHKALAVTTHPAVQLQWTTAEQYRSDVRAFIADQQRRFADVLSTLVRSYILTPEESERSRLNLEMEVIDRRLDHSQSIPNIGVGEQIR